MAELVKKLGGPRTPYSKALADNLMNAQAPQTNPGILGGLGHVFAKGVGGYMEGGHAAQEEERRQALAAALASGDMEQVRAAQADIDPGTAASTLIQDQRIKEENTRADTNAKRDRDWRREDAAQQNEWSTNSQLRGFSHADATAERSNRWQTERDVSQHKNRLAEIAAQGENRLAAVSAKAAAQSRKFTKFTDQNGMTKFQDSTTGDVYEDALDGTLRLVASRQPLNEAAAPMADGDAAAAAPEAATPGTDAGAAAASAPRRNLNMTISRDGSRGQYASGVMVNLKRPDGSDIPDDVFQYAPDVVTANLKARDASVSSSIKASEKRRAQLDESAAAANEEMALVDQFEAVAKGAPRGLRATAVGLANPIYQAVTGDALAGAAQIDSVENLQLYFMKEARKGFPGAVSDYENKLYKAASPSIDKSPMGTFLMSEFLKAKASRAQQRSKLAEEYLADKTAAGLTPVLDAGFQARLNAADKQTMLSPEAEQVLALLGQGKHKEAQAAFRTLQSGQPSDTGSGGADGAMAAQQPAQTASPPAVELQSAPADVQNALKAGKTVEGPDGKKYRLNAQGALEEVQ